ncbi:glycosyltransferase [Agrococcus baldri]|uniref:Glycosyltransferase WbuB n=1 Tax=Agrococcus baldri TaxID=153730 RepID=A0AA87RAW4_9MICO|nr:glycosyltransferase [Agrococcus baldri]GEK79685.1 glycosyltransferase WbuB [Agrococcus baldri]
MPAADRPHRRSAVQRLPRLLGNASMAATTALRSITDDPLTFGIQLARRFPTARGPLLAAARGARGSDRALVETWLEGDLTSTREALDALAGRGGLSRLAAEVAQAAGRPELVADDLAAHPATRARAAWQLGEANEAVTLLAEHAPRSRLHRALRAELALMTPGTRLRWTLRGQTPSNAPRDGVLHLLTNSLPHTQSGYTVRSHEVLKAQRGADLAPTAITRVGYPVVVGGLAARSVDVIDGIAYYRALPARLAPTPDGRLAQQADALAALAGKVAPAVLQTTTHYPNAIVVREVADALGLPWAYEVRGMLEQTWIAGLGSEEARERATASERFRLTREREAELASDADAVFTLSGSMREDLVSRGVPRERIELVPNGIDAAILDRTPPLSADARAALGLPRDGFWVGSTSSLVDYEGFDVLIEAVRLARAGGHDVRLLLVGDGVARPALERQAADAGLGDAARFTGRVARDAVTNYRDALDVFVVPRHDRAVTRTVSPLKPVEAMASGRPLLVSALPPLLETIGAEMERLGSAFIASSPGSLAIELVRLTADASRRAQLVDAGRRRAAELTWSAVGSTSRRSLDAVCS